MKERPMLFSGPMVRAILEDRKTQTRRIVTNESLISLRPDGTPGKVQKRCPYGQPGDRLWVKETFRIWQDEDSCFEGPIGGNLCNPGVRRRMLKRTEYRASSQNAEGIGWRPSIFMTRWLSRITLEITGVRVERLHDISEADAIAEGIERVPMPSGESCWRDYLDGGILSRAVSSYATLWASINGRASWSSNPFVWVVEFKKLEGGAQ